jgi:hypothetical protein
VISLSNFSPIVSPIDSGTVAVGVDLPLKDLFERLDSEDLFRQM